MQETVSDGQRVVKLIIEVQTNGVFVILFGQFDAADVAVIDELNMLFVLESEFFL